MARYNYLLWQSWIYYYQMVTVILFAWLPVCMILVLSTNAYSLKRWQQRVAGTAFRTTKINILFLGEGNGESTGELFERDGESTDMRQCQVCKAQGKQSESRQEVEKCGAAVHLPNASRSSTREKYFF